MHIPSSMLTGSICPVTAVVATAGLIGAGWWAHRSPEAPKASRFAAVTALIFAAQMINFPVQDGTSGHLMGGVLAALLLGIPFGILSIALVLTVQCLVFADGGLAVLGANIFNMALVGAGLGGGLASLFKGRMPSYLGLALAAWVSVPLAALFCSFQLAWAGTIPFATVAPAMLGTHALIGLGEAAITVAALAAFHVPQTSATASSPRSVFVPLAVASMVALLLSPFASSYPDGLEWVAERYQFLHESAPAFVSPLADYAVPLVSPEFLSTGLAGLAGVGLTFLVSWLLARSGWERKTVAVG
jgi:cobalt/nickel transport system permease protein